MQTKLKLSQAAGKGKPETSIKKLSLKATPPAPKWKDKTIQVPVQHTIFLQLTCFQWQNSIPGTGSLLGHHHWPDSHAPWLGGPAPVPEAWSIVIPQEPHKVGFSLSQCTRTRQRRDKAKRAFTLSLWKRGTNGQTPPPEASCRCSEGHSGKHLNKPRHRATVWERTEVQDQNQCKSFWSGRVGRCIHPSMQG